MTGVRHNLPGLDEAAALGATLVAVSGDLLKQVPGLRRRWWNGGEPYLAVTVDEDDAGCVFVEVCLRGRFVRRRRGQKLETGHSDELQPSAGGMPRAHLENVDNVDVDKLNVNVDSLDNVVAIAAAILDGSGLGTERAWLLSAHPEH